MTLNDTSCLMASEDYKERFKAEYFQLKIRYVKLRKFLNDWDAGKLDFVPTCAKQIYTFQLAYMKEYLMILEYRARAEHIDIFKVED